MKVVFRADASLQIGTGHLMRCLTLAEALRANGASCRFLCREHPGHLIDFVRSKGYRVDALPMRDVTTAPAGAADELAHAAWLGSSQEQDAAASLACLGEAVVDWLVVDHYGLDARWEAALKPRCRQLMVIDDLADRPHRCDLLLDQTLGRDGEDYRNWVPAACQLLCGSQYALLRPEFAELRAYSLQRRAAPRLGRLLITMGGVDKDNATAQVLEALRTCQLPPDCRITVVMGATAPWLAEVGRLAATLPWPTQVLAGVSDMAQLMADSDLALGAAGATSWERCCLGLPTIMLVLADNQRAVARGLERAGAALVIEASQRMAERLRELLQPLLEHPAHLVALSQSAARIADGQGVAAVVQLLES